MMMLLSRVHLRAATKLGANPRTAGAPYIRNRGELAIGDAFFLSSDPVVSHIVVGRGARVALGDRVVIGSGAAIACEAEICVGSDVCIGRDVMILDTDFHDAASMDAPGAAQPIVIDDGARIDDGVIVLKGSRIGAGAWVAASSVVSGVVAAGAFVSGVPARVRRERSGGDLGERVRALFEETFANDAWDSLGALRLLLAIEDELGVKLPDGALSRASTVDEVIDLVFRQAP
jgi:acetyltransferase-like isoleucine patch superfamily enzyme